MTYNSLSYGGKIIKQYKKAYNYNIPWIIIFDFTQESDNKLDHHKILHIIEQGKKLGIYTYMFFINNIDDFPVIQKQNPDCAFILYIPPTIITKENINMIKSYHNTFFSLLYQPSLNAKAFKDATNLLQGNHCLFGFHSYYTNENINYILNNHWVSEIVTTESPFVFLIESQNCNPQNASLIHNYVHNIKTNQEHPIFLIDLYEDITQVDNQLSNSPCTLKIMANGDVIYNPSTSSQKHNITNTPLLKLLSTQIWK